MLECLALLVPLGWGTAAFGEELIYRGLNAAAIGLVSGGVYLANGRKLWPLIIAHGLVDSVGLTVLCLGLPQNG